MSLTQDTLKSKAEWNPSGLRMHSELRRLLKSKAALEGISMEEYLHSLLCREFDRPDLYLRPDSAA
jgi:hypothetical protein